MDMDMKLDYDILLMILAAVEHKATLISLMRTCRTLYPNGIPALLRLPGLCKFFYDRDARLASFCEFMLVDNRCRYLTSLDISVIHDCHSPTAFTEDTVNLLVEVLKQAVNLWDLDISNIEWLCETHPIVTTTISSLTSIRDLSLWEGGPRTVEMMRQIRSPIKVMDMRYDSYHLPEENEDPIPMISGLSSTLEQLNTSKYEFRDTSTVFPRLHTLNVTMNTFVDIRPFIACFPNLRSLTFLLHGHVIVPEFEVDEARQSNRDRQLSASWPSLQSLEGTPLSLYLLAVCCPVDHLQITEVSEREMDLLPCVLMETLFTRLTITLLDNCLEWESLPSLLSSSKKLTHLSVLVKFMGPSPPVLTVFDKLLGFIQCPSVTFLEIHLEPYYLDEDLLNDQIRIGIEAYALQVFGIIPTLRSVCLSIGNAFMPSWVYRRNDQSLDPKDGELVMEAEWQMYED